ncbi:MAG: hypothetical protein P8X97_05150 [Candidatus Bathyarchaeota archaeon]
MGTAPRYAKVVLVSCAETEGRAINVAEIVNSRIKAIVDIYPKMSNSVISSIMKI